jgi:hypothetical protein
MCETRSLTLRGEHRLKVLENRVLRRIFGLKWDEIIGGSRKSHIKEPHNVYCSPNISIVIKLKKTRWTGHVARMGKEGMPIGYWWES